MRQDYTIAFESDRFNIRPFKESDIDEFMEYRNDMEWMKYQGFKGLSKGEYEDALLKDVSMEKGMQLAIINKLDDRLIGDLYVRKENETFWIGYTINPKYTRKGYTYEAASALINWINEQGEYTIKAGVLDENLASVKLSGEVRI